MIMERGKPAYLKDGYSTEELYHRCHLKERSGGHPKINSPRKKKIHDENGKASMGRIGGKKEGLTCMEKRAGREDG